MLRPGEWPQTVELDLGQGLQVWRVATPMPDGGRAYRSGSEELHVLND